MTFLIRELNRVCSIWKANYDVFSELNLVFTYNEEGQLLFNGKPVEVCNSPCLVFSNFNASGISFYFAGGSEIHIPIKWPEDEAPIVLPAYANNY